MTEKKASIKCSNCGESLEPNMDSCPKCGSKDRTISVGDIGIGKETVTIVKTISDEYNQLSETFTSDQKRMADSMNIMSTLEQLRKNTENLDAILQNNKRLVELAEEDKSRAIENQRSQRKTLYATTALAIFAIVVAILEWIFPR